MRRIALLVALLTTATLLPTAGPVAAADEACTARVLWVGNDGTTNQVYTANPDGTDRVVVSAVGDDPDPTDNFFPAWSPDGTKISWMGNDGSDNHIYVANADGTDRVKISTADAGTDPIDNKESTISPDGSTIVWAGVIDGDSYLFASDVDGTNRTTIAGPETFLAQPLFSPDGTRLSWLAASGDIHTVVGDADGSNSFILGEPGPDPDPTTDQGAQWSPDGTKIVWHGIPSGGSFSDPWELYVANSADGSERVILSGDGDSATGQRGAWSPDGTKIAYAGGAEDGNDIIVVNADGTDPRVVSNVGEGDAAEFHNYPDWSADGAQLLWIGDGELVVANADGTERTVISDVGEGTDPSGNLFPQWSSCVSSSVETPACPEDPTEFKDQPDGATGDDIECLYGRGIVTGTSNETYSPEDPVTRRQMAAFIARTYRDLAGDCPVAEVPFNDAPIGAAGDDIGCLYGLEVTLGTTDATFSPDSTVTRRQMAHFLARAWRALGGTCPTDPAPFDDVPATGSLAEDISCLYGLGVTNGTTVASYDLESVVDRAHMANFMARFWRKAVADGLHD